MKLLMHFPLTLLLTFIPALLAAHAPLQCPKARRFNGSPGCQPLANNVSLDIFYIRTFERSAIAHSSTMGAFRRMRQTLDLIRKDKRRGYGLVNVDVGGAHFEIAQTFDNDKLHDISKMKDLDLISALRIAAAGLAGSKADAKKLIVVISSTDGFCLHFPRCKSVVETMEKDDHIYTIFVDFQSEKSSSNNHIVYDTNLWPSKHSHGQLFAEYAADCVCRKLAAQDEILTPAAASALRKKRSRMIVILVAVPILTILMLGVGATIFFYLKKGQPRSIKGPATLSGTLAPMALGSKRAGDIKKAEKTSESAKKATVNGKQPENLTATKKTVKL